MNEGKRFCNMKFLYQVKLISDYLRQQIINRSQTRLLSIIAVLLVFLNATFRTTDFPPDLFHDSKMRIGILRIFTTRIGVLRFYRFSRLEEEYWYSTGLFK